jgi:hypothetical protein
MYSFTIPAVALSALAALPAVSAHGYVSGIVAGGKWYLGSNPNWYYLSSKPATAGWYALNQDNGFVSPDAFGTSDIACHKSATPGSDFIPVKAGSDITFQWNTWPDSHHGPVMDYLAEYQSSAAALKFVKIDQGGLINDDSPPGQWASDQLIANNFSWTSTIPSGIANGKYVIRHEIIGLHSANNANGAQNYPQCVNIEVSGGKKKTFDGQLANTFYKSNDPGILITIYQKLSSYTIPGPAVWSPKKSKKVKRSFQA